MAAVEANGKTVEEAIESALEELGAERDEVEVDVLEEPKGGILGVGGHQARVRVWLIGDEDVEDEEDAQPGDEDDDEEDAEDEAEFAAQMLDQLLVHMGIEADVWPAGTTS